jgi:ribose transport system permease protein
MSSVTSAPDQDHEDEVLLEAGPPTTLGSIGRRLFSSTSPFWIFCVLILIVLVFGALKPSEFLGSFNIKTVFIDASVDLVMAVGMTFVIITAGIDLSVGSVLVLSGVLAAKTMSGLGGGLNAGWGIIIVGLIVGLAGGLACGLLQGVLVARFKIPAFIVTLGGFGAFLGLAQVFTKGVDANNVPTKLGSSIGNGSLGPIPWLVIIALAVAILGGLCLFTTRFGRYTYAIGSNAEGARRTGINVTWHLVKVYGLIGLLSGLAGDLSLAHFTTTTIGAHNDDNLTVITAVILGGTSLFGGSGNMFGTVVGTLIPVALDSGLVITGVQSFWQGVAVGVVLVAAVYADQLRRKARASS